MSELKRCPFCGSDKVELYWSDHEHAIWCKNCSGGVCNWNITKDELIKEWNTRSKADVALHSAMPNTTKAKICPTCNDTGEYYNNAFESTMRCPDCEKGKQ